MRQNFCADYLLFIHWLQGKLYQCCILFNRRARKKSTAQFLNACTKMKKELLDPANTRKVRPHQKKERIQTGQYYFTQTDRANTRKVCPPSPQKRRDTERAILFHPNCFQDI